MITFCGLLFLVFQGNTAPSDPLAALSAFGDLLGSGCLHRTAITCAASSTECGNVAFQSSFLALAPCVCDACPQFPKIYDGMGALMTDLSQMSGGTPTAEQLDSLLTAFCPMSSILECLDSNSACSSAVASFSDFSVFRTLQSQCATAGKPTSYATTYSFTSPTCPAQETSGADGLLQLNLLAGSLLSILS